ncbi:MAG TPA: M48 family peptidase [Rhodobacteraceae bacterium]|jgi:predicted metal-dependent hydrolase|nr:M48 family peptidase [Paracoccaceae bacterium]HBV54553.1 M48 family peptidase [Paracoccaceae bacterium]
MGQHTLPGNPPVEVILRKSARARRISLRVSRLDGRVTLTLPPHASEREALAFAQEKADWLRRQLAARPAETRVGVGYALPVEGQSLLLQSAETGRAPRIEGELLLVPGPESRAAARAMAFLKLRARDRLAAASDRYAARLGLSYASLTLRDTRSRWGSCTADGALMYSWRLIMAPPAVLEYVAAHEVAHLAEMNHAPAFWQTVARIHGPYAEPRGWLKRQGHHLHQYRFD